ncbi:MAG: Asp/Glu racemase [Acidobacteria bacterium RIFCSPLOWO2_02_FULL_68_18]|nr:MAG: Asp/Glu racemase [Acidobacteria bacterium RIFCSPLOWO2_02_FULL_68_18]OFW51475.1 MAG: Asp/Glu racemase [Acidobacteria bacterium RIFCSPLOWO2_12_FULL_68_19]
MMKRQFRIGQIVPSSNTTMETEIPAMLRARESVEPERFTFHSSRMRMKRVTREELAAMDAESERCAAELADARVDVIGYACLVATMSMGQGYHCQSERRLHEVTRREGAATPVVTSAGALVHGLTTLGAKKIAMVAPYMRPLTDLVAAYLEHEGLQVVDKISLEIPDNVEVGRRDPLALVDIYRQLTLDGADALVLSSCVQMPSLAAIPLVERECGRPVVSAAVCTTYQMLQRLGLRTYVPDAGALLSGSY